MSIGRFRQPSYLYGVGIHKLFTDGVRSAVLVEANDNWAFERTLPTAFSANHRSPYASIKFKLETCTLILSSRAHAYTCSSQCTPQIYIDAPNSAAPLHQHNGDVRPPGGGLTPVRSGVGHPAPARRKAEPSSVYMKLKETSKSTLAADQRSVTDSSFFVICQALRGFDAIIVHN
jgi:hypothetical protein